jgi:hypothetical protein
MFSHAEALQSRRGSARLATVITRLTMAKKTVITQKRRGPKPTGKGTLLGVRFQPPLLKALDAWIVKNMPGATRPEAIRRLVAQALGLKE